MVGVPTKPVAVSRLQKPVREFDRARSVGMTPNHAIRLRRKGDILIKLGSQGSHFFNRCHSSESIPNPRSHRETLEEPCPAVFDGQIGAYKISQIPAGASLKDSLPVDDGEFGVVPEKHVFETVIPV